MNWLPLQLPVAAIFLLQLLTVAPVSAENSSPAMVSATAGCKALENVDFSGIADAPTQIIEAKIVEATGVVPTICLAKGYITSHVGIELRLPITNWNGKFLEVGCGGDCGVFFHSCAVDRCARDMPA
jgi:hypothetical protein